MTRIDVRDLKGKIKDNAVQVTLDVIGKKHDLMLAYQNTGFGKKRFFVCPYCSKNVQYLYITGNGLKCRTCGDVKYTGIQNNTKGGYDEIAYRMKKYAAAHDIQFSFPFNYLDFVLDDRMHREKLCDSAASIGKHEISRNHLQNNIQCKDNQIGDQWKASIVAKVQPDGTERIFL